MVRAHGFQAQHFARECARRERQWLTSPDPGVYRIVMPESRVLAYSNRKEEQEFIVLLQPGESIDRLE